MKITRLAIENYGIHIDREFTLCDRSLHVIHGPNEAGKSTLLQMIRDLLFGFGSSRSNPFAQGTAKQKTLAKATVLLADGRAATIQRAAGTKGTLTGSFSADGGAFDEAAWQQLLSGADRRLYENVFGFSLAELTAGEETLKQSSLDEALFGGGLGRLGEFKQRIDGLNQQAESLFKPRGQNQVINKLLTEVKDCHTKLREATLRPAQYDEWRREADRLQQEEAATKATQHAASRRKGRLERLRRALPIFRQREELLRQLQRLIEQDQGKVACPAEIVAGFATEKERERQLLKEIQTEEAMLRRVTEQRDAIEIPERLLAQAAEIRGLVQSVEQMRGYRHDIPLRERDHQGELAAAERLIARVHPDWTLEQLSDLRLSLAERDQIQELAKRQTAAAIRLEDRAKALDKAAKDQAKLERQLAELTTPEGANPSALVDQLSPPSGGVQPRRSRANPRALADQLPQCRTWWETREQRQLDLQARQRTCEQLQNQLRPICPAPSEEIGQWPVPAEATQKTYQQEFQRQATRLRDAEQLVGQQQTQLQLKQDELQTFDRRHQVITREQLDQARTARDATWGEIRAAIFEPTPPVAPSEAAVEQSESLTRLIVEADSLADRRQQDATQIARRDEVVAEIAAREKSLAQAEETLAQVQADGATLQTTWQAEWKDLPVEVRTPDEMLAWTATLRQLTQEQTAKESVREELARLDGRIEDFFRQAREALAIEPGGSPDETLARIAQAIDEARSAEKNYEKLHSKQETLAEDYAEAAKAHAAAEAELAEIRSAAEPLLARFKELDADNLDLANRVIQAVEEARDKQTAALGLAQRVDDMRAGLAQFTDRANQVFAALGQTPGEVPIEELVHQLSDTLDQAQQARREFETLGKSVDAATAELTQHRTEQEQLAAKLADWRKQTGVADDAELEARIEAVNRRNKLEEELRELEVRLAEARESEEEGEFLEAIAQADADQLEIDLTEAQQRYDEANETVIEINRQLARLQINLEGADDSGQAIALQGRIEELQTEIAMQVDRLCPLLIARSMIDRAIADYRQQNEGSLLASISELFSRLTLGNYAKVERQLDESGTMIAIDRNGQEKTADQLSTGAREQLYLAFRLAYIRDYCGQSEPLPLVMDDILVNFDDERQLGTLKVLLDFDPRVQILLLTCHEAMLQKVKSLDPEATVTSLAG